MGWDDESFDGGTWMKIPHNSKVLVQIHGIEFVQKDWGDGKGPKSYVQLEVTNLDDGERIKQTLEVPKYRAAPLAVLRNELKAAYIDIADRAIEIYQSEGPHPNDSMKRLVRWVPIRSRRWSRRRSGSSS